MELQKESERLMSPCRGAVRGTERVRKAETDRERERERSRARERDIEKETYEIY